MIVWFVLLAAGGISLALVAGDGNGAGLVVGGVLLVVFGFGGLVGWRTYRWQKHDRERWVERFGKGRR